MKESDSPLPLWDYCLERRVWIHNLTAKGLFNLHVSNAHANLLNETGDISNLCTYKWCDQCYFRENKEKITFNREALGHMLGPTKGEGNEMAQQVLKSNGQVVPQHTSRPLKVEEMHNPVEVKKSNQSLIP